ncbi:hypothetical protein BG262_06755 [Floricoccus penangensis]|uniref:T-Q ester bond containing domain-containing protein n=2 Tax=Floricoccus penangensis TaxID=1859475 RepID=A0A9Q5JFJ3_9LACT|nr:hypothetical protein BG262_06755 [Floricoccus penangensis]
MDKSTNKPLLVDGKEVTGSTTFTAEKANGSVDVTFTFDASALEGKTIVVFEKLFQNGKEVASHEDINDKAQTVTVETPKKPGKPGKPGTPGTPNTPKTPNNSTKYRSSNTSSSSNLPSTGENETLANLFVLIGSILLVLSSIYVANKKINA